MKLIILLIYSIIGLIHNIDLQKKKQLMSPSEITTSINTNLSHFGKFVAIISKKKNEKAKKKCEISLKNLKALITATEKSNIYVNPLTLITINGIIWHPEACNNPKIMSRHIELYYSIRSSPLFQEFISNPSIKKLEKESSSYSLLNKSFFRNRKSNSNQLPIIKNLNNRNNLFGSKEKLQSLSNITKITDILIRTVQDANITTKDLDLEGKQMNVTGDNFGLDKKQINTTESTNSKCFSEVYKLPYNESYTDFYKKEREKELQELLSRRSVSSKSETGFKDSLNRLLQEKINMK